ncbi:MAG: hypothetical protein M1818_007114 [Claussenomyces sp. TS43310]|nr:MAG: hypothetical protein M1818_007114 [Claussenomyces sp. TS43310]
MGNAQKQNYAPLLTDEVCDVCGPAKIGHHKRGYFALAAKSLSLSILVLVALALVRIVFDAPSSICRPQAPTDVLFGEIPWRTVVIENDQRFIDEPFADYASPTYNDSMLWRSIDPGTFVAFDDPSLGGVTGKGMRMADVAVQPSDFPETSEGFGVAVMHQLHCVKTVKRTLLELEAGMTMTHKHHDHAHHCVEMLRQAVMCHSDLTLEHPAGFRGREHVSGWGYPHVCRDFETVLEKIKEIRLRRTQRGWIRNPWPSEIEGRVIL